MALFRQNLNNDGCAFLRFMVQRFVNRLLKSVNGGSLSGLVLIILLIIRLKCDIGVEASA